MKELTNAEKDLVLLGMICSSINATPMTLTEKQNNNWRKASRMRWYYYEHRRICRDTFLFLMDISRDKLTNLKKHYLENGLVPRRKKSGKLRCLIVFIILFLKKKKKKFPHNLKHPSIPWLTYLATSVYM